MLKLNGATDDGDYEESAEPAGGGGDERAGADEPNARAEIARPPNPTDADWAFYCMCAAAQASFDAKFHKVRFRSQDGADERRPGPRRASDGHFAALRLRSALLHAQAMETFHCARRAPPLCTTALRWSWCPDAELLLTSPLHRLERFVVSPLSPAVHAPGNLCGRVLDDSRGHDRIHRPSRHVDDWRVQSHVGADLIEPPEDGRAKGTNALALGRMALSMANERLGARKCVAALRLAGNARAPIRRACKSGAHRLRDEIGLEGLISKIGRVRLRREGNRPGA